MIRIRAASRLHFGLLSFPTDEPAARWTNFEGQSAIPSRSYGGVGLMVENPGLSLLARQAASWQARGLLAERVLDFARRCAEGSPAANPVPLEFILEHCAPEHCGLGTGTQLALAVARSLIQGHGGVLELAQRVGRGRRSALGIHGFAQGGFLVEGGQRHPGKPAPLVARVDFPEEWRLVLVLPAGSRGLSGREETTAFERLHNLAHPLARTDTLCRLVLFGLLPALQEADLEAFGEALYDFNARVGAAFAPVQSGNYTSPQTADLIAFLRRQGVRGVGQSSWGPTVFAVLPDSHSAEHLADRLRKHFALDLTEVMVTRAWNHGAVCQEFPETISEQEPMGKRGQDP